ncbi:MAG: RHS repeat-associated core domain-containing protein [Paludibacteraceae bacterium]|nr:RHS repeat-associated core domain-containing protein [Paludibacteraceae bacterium]
MTVSQNNQQNALSNGLGGVSLQTEDRYTFTSKELDAESNLYYYDARYNSSTYSQFNSPDPMSDKYPSVSPYLYCAGNPIRFVDPTGMEFDEESAKIASKDKYQLLSQMRHCYAELDNPLYHISDEERNDINARIAEIERSLDDLQLMMDDKAHLFTYKSNNGAKGGFYIGSIRERDVTVYYGTNDPLGLRIHENRHWGDILRGYLTEDNYCREHEITAYRAQYAARGGDYSMWIILDNGLPFVTSFNGHIEKFTPHIIDSLIYSLEIQERVYNFNDRNVITK